jgi:hypothetical protein
MAGVGKRFSLACSLQCFGVVDFFFVCVLLVAAEAA